MEILKKGDVIMEKPEGLPMMIEKLMKGINETKESQQNIINQAKIAREIASRTDNVENLRLICDDNTNALEHVIENDMKLFGELYEMLETLRQFPW